MPNTGEICFLKFRAHCIRDGYSTHNMNVLQIYSEAGHWLLFPNGCDILSGD